MSEQPAGKMDELRFNEWWHEKFGSPYRFQDSHVRITAKEAYGAGWQAHAAVAESDKLKLRREAYQECAAKACGEIGCFEGVHQTNNPHAKWLCPAYKIFAAIALLDLEIAKGAAK